MNYFKRAPQLSRDIFVQGQNKLYGQIRLCETAGAQVKQIKLNYEM